MMIAYISRLLVAELLLIFFLLLREIGFWNWLYMQLATHPKADKIIYILGDVNYMVGGSVFGAAVYSVITEAVTPSMAYAGFIGFVMIVVGAYFRFRKD